MTRCAKCGFECRPEISAQYFYRNKRGRNGFGSYCKNCIAVYYVSHREQILEQQSIRNTTPEVREKRRVRAKQLRFIKEGNALPDPIIVTPLSQFPDERGSVKLIMQSGDPDFGQLQQVYVSTVYPGTIKGWHLHHKKSLNYVCVFGMVRLVIAPDMDAVPIKRSKPVSGEFREIVIGSTNYCLVHIPPGHWNAFMGLGDKEAVIVNCATLSYSEDDIERLPYDYFAYDWTFKHG